jgi:hypothetical protein
MTPSQQGVAAVLHIEPATNSAPAWRSHRHRRRGARCGPGLRNGSSRECWSLALDQRAFGPRRIVVVFGERSARLSRLAHTRRIGGEWRRCSSGDLRRAGNPRPAPGQPCSAVGSGWRSLRGSQGAPRRLVLMRRPSSFGAPVWRSCRPTYVAAPTIRWPLPDLRGGRRVPRQRTGRIVRSTRRSA